MHVFVFTSQVDVNTDVIDNLNVDFFEAICKSILVDVLLHGIKVEGQSLILCSDRTPQVEQFTKRILLETCK